MTRPPSAAPIQNGHIAEAIGDYVLGPGARWIGGRNPGYDLEVDGVKVDVKSGVRKPSILRAGAGREDCIGIHLNKGVSGLQEQDVDELLIVVRDAYSNSESRVSFRDGNAHVELSVDVEGVSVYRLPIDAVTKLFKQPFKRDGSRRVSTQNVDAAITGLEPYLVQMGSSSV